MNIEFIDLFSGSNIINFFFKAFALVFSFLFVLYSIVIYKQTQVMIRSVNTKNNSFILLLSLIQIVIGLILFTLAFIII